jgi:hypothetical protein
MVRAPGRFSAFCSFEEQKAVSGLRSVVGPSLPHLPPFATGFATGP